MSRRIDWRALFVWKSLRWLSPMAWFLLLSLGFTLSAQAHTQANATGGFANGLLHPVSGLDHVVAMVSVGLWGAQLGRPAIWVLPVAFPLTMAVGGFLGLIGMPMLGVEMGIAASAIFLGTAVLFEARPQLPFAGALIGTFAIFHGYAHGAELPPGDSALAYSFGFIVATGVLHGCGIGVGLIHRWRWGQRLLRIAGGAVLATGSVFLWKALG